MNKNLKINFGTNLFELVVNYKQGKEGYISNVLDKVIGIMKLLIEQKYMNNKTYIKAICSIFQGRFKQFLKNDTIKSIKTKEFLMNLVRENYIYIKEHMMNNDKELFEMYFLPSERAEFENELKTIKEKPSAFLA